jgi:membrane-associated phospholipid phosphatase
VILATLAVSVLMAGHGLQADGRASNASISQLPKRVARDARRLFTTKTPVLILAGGGLAAYAVHAGDHAAVRHLSSSPGLEGFLDGGADAGDAPEQGLTAIGVYAAGYALGSERAKEVGTSLVEAQLMDLFMTQGIKYAVNRERPDGGRYSFPSGHTSSTFATADVLLQEFGPKVGALAYAGAVYVGVSRLAEREHFLSDVVFGAAVGIASARTLGFHAGHRSVSISPSVMRGGAGVFVYISRRECSIPNPRILDR